MKSKSDVYVLLLVFVVTMAAFPMDTYCTSTGSKGAATANEILTPAPKPQPRINGPMVYGCRPGHFFLYRIPCQGERPITFSAKGLPGQSCRNKM